MLTIRNSLPDGLLGCSARDLHSILDGPTLIELPGERDEPLFVSILAHGNEDVGLGAIQCLFKSYAGKPFPRALMLLVGNVTAAKEGVRRCEGQPDYNRIWPGTLEDEGAVEVNAMSQVHRRVLERKAFAAIDLHNNTGRNPYYAVVCTRNPGDLFLASLFAERAVLFRGLPGTQTASFAGRIPAMTAECGQPGHALNVEAAAGFLDRVFAIGQLPDQAVKWPGLTLYHTLATLRISEGLSFSFGEEVADLVLDPELDRMNFTQVAPGTVFGRSLEPAPFTLTDEDGRNVTTQFFRVENGQVRLTRAVTPAMLTLDPRVVRQDCLGYLMEPVNHF